MLTYNQALRDLSSYSEVIAAQREKIGQLLAALEFVRNDPCFKLLGTVTHDTVTDALGLTNILSQRVNRK